MSSAGAPAVRHDAPVELLRVPDPVPDDLLDGLVDLLRDAVAGGASVGFVRVPAVPDAARWWRGYLPGGWTWVAVEDGPDGRRVVGTVSLRTGQPENGTHRADLTKLLVHSGSRGRGVAGRLMAAAEGGAREAGRTLLVLDTETGSPAEGMYERWGWTRVGTIDGYAVNPDGRSMPTTLFSKRFRGEFPERSPAAD